MRAFNIARMKKAFDSLSYGMDKRKVFDLFLDLCLQAFNLFDPERQNKINAVYDSIAYNKEEAPDRFKEMILGLGDASDPDGEGLQDALGYFYMSEIATGNLGQFFTPIEICDLMASLTIGDIDNEDLEHRKTVCDPACGSGTMLLSAAKKSKRLLFYGADLDYTCCKMAAINLLINGLEGEISHMDTLSLKFHGAFRIGRTTLGNIPAYKWFTDKDESVLFKTKIDPEVVKVAHKNRPAYLPGLF